MPITDKTCKFGGSKLFGKGFVWLRLAIKSIAGSVAERVVEGVVDSAGAAITLRQS